MSIESRFSQNITKTWKKKGKKKKQAHYCMGNFLQITSEYSSMVSIKMLNDNR